MYFTYRMVISYNVKFQIAGRHTVGKLSYRKKDNTYVQF